LAEWSAFLRELPLIHPINIEERHAQRFRSRKKIHFYSREKHWYHPFYRNPDSVSHMQCLFGLDFYLSPPLEKRRRKRKSFRRGRSLVNHRPEYIDLFRQGIILRWSANGYYFLRFSNVDDFAAFAMLAPPCWTLVSGFFLPRDVT